MTSDEVKNYVNYRLRSAYDTLEAAKILAENGYWNSAVNRLYYSVYYLVIRKVKFIEWLFFNACSPSNLAYLAGFIVWLATKDKTVLYIGILPIFFFGTLGMFVFSWKGMNIIPQVAHLIMTLNIIWLTISTFLVSSYKSATIGLLSGIFVFSIFIAFQQNYVRSHQENFKRIFLSKLSANLFLSFLLNSFGG